MIAIIDYGAGNLRSVQKAFEYIGAQTQITSDIDTIAAAPAVVLPGVGSFRDAMHSLQSRNLCDGIKQVIEKNTPFLGICLGQQLLFEWSQEGDMEHGVQGLGIFPGKVLKIPAKDDLKVPHMGWNTLNIRGQSPLFKGLASDAFFYFVHSYYVHAEDSELVLARCDYGVSMDVIIGKGNVFATQFHPEKSGSAGLKMLENFYALVNK